MLDLNAMFGSCESIFDQQPKYTSTPDVSATELQMMEMEISTDLAEAEASNIKASTTMSQLDQLLNMYYHVKRFGIDRTFLSLYNNSNQLDNMIGVQFPSCESVDSEGYPGSNMSRAFIAAMEDEKEGIFAKIGKGIKWIWEKIKHICTVVWNKLKSWLGLSTKRNESILSKIADALRGGAKPKSVKRFITKKKVAVATAAITATIGAVYAWRKYITSKTEAHTTMPAVVTGSSGTSAGVEAIYSLDSHVRMGDVIIAALDEAKKLQKEAKDALNAPPETIEAPSPQVTGEIVNESKAALKDFSGVFDKADAAIKDSDQCLSAIKKEIDKRLSAFREKDVSEYGAIITQLQKELAALNDAYNKQIEELKSKIMDNKAAGNGNKVKTCERIMTADKAGNFIRLYSRAGHVYYAEPASIKRDFYGNVISFKDPEGVKYAVNSKGGTIVT